MNFLLWEKRKVNTKYKIAKMLHNHKLRHIRITRWKKAGMDMEAIKKAL